MRVLMLLLLATGVGCRSLAKVAAPSNVRNWSPDQAVLPYAEFHENEVIVHNVRHCRYFSDDAYVVQHDDQTYNLDHLQAVDFFIVPFDDTPAVAHTMLSFEFAPPEGELQHLAVSVEIRKEEGESYAIWKGSARQYELMYVLADERDVIGVRANHRGENIYLYRTTATPQQARRLLVDVLGRTNELASRPEFYDTVLNNCTTNIVRHINRIKPRRLRYDYRVLLPGYSDQLAYDEGLIQRKGTFEETRAAAYVTPQAIVHAGREEFSELIRR